MWDEAPYGTKSDENMAVWFGMKQSNNSTLQIFSSHRPPDSKQEQERAAAEQLQLLLHGRFSNKKSGNSATGPCHLDLESKRDSLVRYLGVRFVCDGHSAAVMADGVNTSRCTCNYLGMPSHLSTDAEYRHLIELFATNNKNTLLAEMGMTLHQMVLYTERYEICIY